MAQPVGLVVNADRPGVAIQPGLSGIFYEDINFGADGGLYAEDLDSLETLVYRYFAALSLTEERTNVSIKNKFASLK